MTLNTSEIRLSQIPRHRRTPSDPGLGPLNTYFGELNKLYVGVARAIGSAAEKHHQKPVQVELRFYNQEQVHPYDFQLYFIKNETGVPGIRVKIKRVGTNGKFNSEQTSDILKYEIALVDHKTGDVSKFKRFNFLPGFNHRNPPCAELELFLSDCKPDQKLEFKFEERKSPDFNEEYPRQEFAFSLLVRKCGKLVLPPD